MRKILLDTNFLLDFIDETRPESEYACELFRRTVSGEFSGVIAASSLKDMYYIACKRGSEQEARDWANMFIWAFDVEPLDVEICVIAASSDEPDFEDGCVRASAERAQVDFIITRDRTAFERSWVKAYSAREFLELFPAKESGTGEES